MGIRTNSFFEDQSRAHLLASLHSTEYESLVDKLASYDQSKFVCLKPNCLNRNVEQELRKFIVLQSVIRQINLGVSSGLSFDAAVETVPGYCSCVTPPCGCEDLTPGLSGGSGGSGD